MTQSKCVTSAQGTKWWLNDEDRLHRLDGPALEWVDGSKAWYINNGLHRLDGPAIEDCSGAQELWVNNKKLTKKQFDRHPLVVFHRLCKERV
jgi:hypothetical protein